MTTTARILSVLFHPLLLTTYLFATLAAVLPTALAPVYSESFGTFLLMIFLVTFVLPVICMGIFKTFGTINSFTMKTRRERLIPFIFITGIYVATTWMFLQNGGRSLDDNLIRLLMVIDGLVMVATLVTFFYKVSVHSLAIWGIIGVMMVLARMAEINTMLYISTGMIVLAGFVMAARLHLGAHSAAEVFSGAALGLVASILGMLILY